MAMKQGERYVCPDSSCGCEIQVTKAAKPGGGGEDNPRCGCGEEMQVQGQGKGAARTGGASAEEHGS